MVMHYRRLGLLFASVAFTILCVGFMIVMRLDMASTNPTYHANVGMDTAGAIITISLAAGCLALGAAEG